MIGSLLVVMCPPAIAAAAVEPTIPIAASGADDARGAAVALAFMGLCSLVYAVTRATAVRRTFVTSRHKIDASIEQLRAIAQTQRARALAFATACVFVGLAIARLPFALDVRLILGVTPALMFFVGLVSAWQLQRLLRAAADPTLHVSTHGRSFYLARRRRLVGWVTASPSIVARVSELPLARLHVRPL